MDVCKGDTFVHNGIVCSKDSFLLPGHPSAAIYEVIRVTKKTPLFLDDHLERLINSIKKTFPKASSQLNKQQLINDIYLLLHENEYGDGNFRYDVYLLNETANRLVYYIPHSYPTTDMYIKGVDVSILKATRLNPNAKTIRVDLKNRVENTLQSSELYELLLLSENNCITEGSRSNVFFIKGNSLYTAPDELVLMGITRKYVIDIAKQNKIPLIFEAVNQNELDQYNAAFITGTSPKVLPIHKIDNFEFEVGHSLIKTLSYEYNNLINNHIKNNKNSKNV